MQPPDLTMRLAEQLEQVAGGLGSRSSVALKRNTSYPIELEILAGTYVVHVLDGVWSFLIQAG